MKALVASSRGAMLRPLSNAVAANMSSASQAMAMNTGRYLTLRHLGRCTSEDWSHLFEYVTVIRDDYQAVRSMLQLYVKLRKECRHDPPVNPMF
jgi:hypothetical protein